MDPNMDDWIDYHGIEVHFEEMVVHYLEAEWMVNVYQYPQHIRDKVFLTINMMRGKSSIPHVAGVIAMEVLPI